MFEIYETTYLLVHFIYVSQGAENSQVKVTAYSVPIKSQIVNLL